MLTIGQLASYAGVTVRAVRHYHHVGLLPEPERDHSGYRSYDAASVVRLIRIRTLAEAGVPLARVEELLDADPADFATAVAEIDQRLRSEVRELQEHRRRIAALAAGDSLALPSEVVAYLDRLREVGVAEEMVAGERDGWILMAARWPDQIPDFMADKQRRLDDPRTVRLYHLIGELAESGYDEERLAGVADLMIELTEESERDGQLQLAEDEMGGDAFIAVMDAFATDSHPMVARLQELMAERGWTGWSNMQRSEGRG